MLLLIGNKTEIVEFLNNESMINCPKKAHVIEECPRGSCLECVLNNLKLKPVYMDE